MLLHLVEKGPGTNEASLGRCYWSNTQPSLAAVLPQIKQTTQHIIARTYMLIVIVGINQWIGLSKNCHRIQKVVPDYALHPSHHFSVKSCSPIEYCT